MRYIGNKRLLVHQIDDVINENTKNAQTFIDIFAGSGSVGKYFKEKYKIIANDYLTFAYALQKGYIENNIQPDFKRLQKTRNIHNPIEFFNTYPIDDIELQNSFIYENYSPNEKSDRKYFTNENAIKIDFIRTTINKWLNLELISEKEFFYLLTCLIEAVTPISNTSGTYGAYLKKWDSRSLHSIELKPIDLFNNNQENQCFNEDANEIIKKIKGDILYLDPPYNTRQYASNYHLLETIAKYNFPDIKGVTGLPIERDKSSYSSKRTVEQSLEHLIKHANCKYIIMSYSTDGILEAEKIGKIFKTYGKSNTFKLYKIPYRRFKSNNAKQDTNTLYELIFFVER